MDTISIEYRFGFRGEREDMVFTVGLDPETGLVLSPAESRAEPWTVLSYCQCPFCPFQDGKTEHCPVAWNISGVAARFRDVFSIEESDIVVTTRERTYSRRDKVSQGLRSILGLYLAASGCPGWTSLSDGTLPSALCQHGRDDQRHEQLPSVRILPSGQNPRSV